MKSKIILARYGQYENGHLNNEGKETMLSSAERISPNLSGKILIVSAEVPRAFESAEVLAEAFGIKDVEAFPEFYAAPEDNIPIDLLAAKNRIDSLIKDCDTLIAVVSKEYIDALPGYILGIQKPGEEPSLSLRRGEAVVIDCNSKALSCLRN